MQRVDKYVQLALMIGSVLMATSDPSTPLHDAFNSQQAYAYTAEIAGFGERWPGSPGHRKTENIIRQVLQKDGAQIESDNFVATTPRGPIPVHNIIGKFSGFLSSLVIMTLSLSLDLLALMTVRRALRFFSRLPTHWPIRRPGCKSGWSGPTWKKRSTISKAMTVSTGVYI